MLAVAAKYMSLLFVPSIVVLAGLAAVPKSGRKAMIAPVALGVTTAGLLAGVLYLAGPDDLTGIKFTTVNRFQGNSSVPSLLWDCVQWIGAFSTGNGGYVAAIQAGYFQVVAYNYQATPTVDGIAWTLVTDPDYALASVIPNGNDTVR